MVAERERSQTSRACDDGHSDGGPSLGRADEGHEYPFCAKRSSARRCLGLPVIQRRLAQSPQLTLRLCCTAIYSVWAAKRGT